ncbi:helix-turn-helix transcriptional regulator [Yoonia sp. 208BN28-4]|uniref:helix-turn-helix transcriptional regulator n=1 Tax=Yoonia sp. 208BN28-4 TaxID=3126505 RepID=UPI0030B4C915
MTEIAQLWDTCLAVLSEHGVDFVIYNTVDANGDNPFVLTNVPEIFATVDPTNDPFLAHCCTSYEIWSTGPEFLPDYDYLPPAAKAFISAASRTGFRAGLGIPMRLEGSERYGGFNIGTQLNRAAFEAQILPLAEDFRFFCLLMHRRIEELSRDGLTTQSDDFRALLVAPENAVLANLSPREKEVIYLVAKGVSRKECARLCGISPNTVAEYTKSAYRKLGVQNRVEVANLVTRSTG